MRYLLLAIMVLLALLPSAHAQKASSSGVSPQAISLPSGPGSIEGLGESFEPQLNSGTFAYSLPLRVPPGRAGFAPELALIYDSGTGNGPLGPGWRLAGLHVRRQTDKGLPRYGAADTFINDRGEELVRVEGSPTDEVQVFRLKNEGAFTRYEYRFIEDRWICTDRSGRRYFLGLGESEDHSEEARVQSPEGDTYAWHLVEAVDTNDNRLFYTYLAEGAQLYPRLIEYGATESNDSIGIQAVELLWEERPDTFLDCRPTFCLATARRLDTVAMSNSGNLVRRYEMSYDVSRGLSTLARVTLVGDDGASMLPPVKFAYTVSLPLQDPPLIFLDELEGARLPRPGADNDGAIEIVDFNADALPDFYATGDSCDIFFENMGSYSFAEQQLCADESLGVSLFQSSKTFLRDIDGNGTADILAQQGFNSESFVQYQNMGGAWANNPIQVALPPGVTAQDVFLSDNIRATDLDFDKRIDTIRSVRFTDVIGERVAFIPYLNRDDGLIITEPQTEPIDDLSLTFNDPSGRLLLADMNGDRLQDLVLLRDRDELGGSGPICWMSKGFGNFDNSITFDNPPDFENNQIRLNNAEASDLDGDGLTDIFEIRSTFLRCWRNFDGSSFSDPITIDFGKFYNSDCTTWRLADLDGDGLDELLFYTFCQEFPDHLPIGFYAVRLFGPQPPNLLLSATNGIGRTTQVEYRSHTVDLLRDRDNEIDWDSPPPFPVTVVAAIEESDGLDTYRSEFSYSQGDYDGEEKEFRGFASATRRDIGDTSAPTLVSEFEFDTGRAFEALKGVLLGSETRTESGAIFHQETATWNTLTLFPPEAGRDERPVVFPYRASLVREIIEQGSAPTITTETHTRFDDYGNETLRAEFGIVEGNDYSVGNDERVTVSSFTAEDDSGKERWILDRPVRVEVRDESALVLEADGFSITGPEGIVQRKIHFYDDENFLGNNEGAVDRGNLTMTRDWIDPTDPSAYAITLRQRFDSHGNPTLMMDALGELVADEPDASAGHFRTVRYDADFSTFPVEETIHIGSGSESLTMTAEWDAGFGLVTASTDFNGNPTRYEYDAFGRPEAVYKPGDPDGWPTTRYQFGLAIPAETGRVVNYIETQRRDLDPPGPEGARERYHIAREYVDGLGRKLMTREEASEDGETRVAVTGASDFNARKGVSSVLQPFFSRRPGTLDERLEFEDIRANGWSGDFHENGALVTFDLSAAHQTRTDYDAMLRPTLVTNPDGTAARAVYEPLAKRAFDENDDDPSSPFADTPMLHRMDGLERLVAVEELVRLDDNGEPVGDLRAWTTRYHYREDDLLTEILDANNNRKWMEYDGLQRMTFMNDPNRGILSHAYDAINMIERQDAKGQVTRYVYDGANRLLSEDYLDEGMAFSANLSPDVEYLYDAAATEVDLGDGTLGATRNNKGMLTRVADLAGEETFSYDERGRIEWSVRSIPDPELDAPAAFQTAFSYDALDRPTSVTYPDGDRVAMAYNERSLLERLIGGATANAGGSPNALGALDYLPSGQVSRMLTGDGNMTTRAYDRRLRMNELRVAGDSELLHYGYEFDPVSNITSIEDRRPASAEPEGSPLRNTQLFHYDDLYRLTGVQYSWNAPGNPIRDDGNIAYRYNRIGNMVSQTSDIDDRDEQGRSITNLGARQHGGAGGDSNREGRSPGDPPGPHALTATDNGEDARTLPYDDNGNLTELDGLALTWDFKDRLASAENDAMRAEYRYDHTDRRVIRHVVSKADNSPETTLYVNRWFEVRENEQPAKYLWNGETRVARATGTLDESAPRVQRWRLREGWNTISVAIDAPDLAERLGVGTPRVRAAFLWRPGTTDYEAVDSQTPLPPGSVLRLDMAEAAVVSAKGAYERGAARPIKAPGDYVGSALLEAAAVAELLPPEVTAAWVSDGAGDWLLAFPAENSALPVMLAPGAALHARSDANTALFTPDASTQIQYYHQDHLGSSNVVTDGSGALLERAVYYPYGHPRATESLIAGTGRLDAKYGFTQKERDAETGLNYFEARYYAPELGVFASTDPLVFNVPEIKDADPYRYGSASPLVFFDPTGKRSSFRNQRSNNSLNTSSGNSNYITERGAIQRNPLWMGKNQEYDPFGDLDIVIKGSGVLAELQMIFKAMDQKNEIIKDIHRNKIYKEGELHLYIEYVGPGAYGDPILYRVTSGIPEWRNTVGENRKEPLIAPSFHYEFKPDSKLSDEQNAALHNRLRDKEKNLPWGQRPPSSIGLD